MYKALNSAHETALIRIPKQSNSINTIIQSQGTTCYMRGAFQLVEIGNQTLVIKPGRTKGTGIIQKICQCLGSYIQSSVIIDEEIRLPGKPNKLLHMSRQEME